MALYEYKCKDCGVVFEKLVFSSDESVACEKCGSANIEKLLSSFAISTAPSKSSAPPPTCPAAGSCPSGTCGLA